MSVTRYGKSKITEEQILLKTSSKDSELVILRIANVYGNSQFDDFVNHILTCAKTGKEVSLIHKGRATRNFIWIEDLTSILVELLRKEQLPKVINLGSPTSISLKKLITEIESIIDSEILVLQLDGDSEIIYDSIIDTTLMQQLTTHKGSEIRFALENYISGYPEFRS